MKTKYLRCNYNNTDRVDDQEVTITEDVVTSTTKFKYLRSIILNNGEIDGGCYTSYTNELAQVSNDHWVLCDKSLKD